MATRESCLASWPCVYSLEIMYEALGTIIHSRRASWWRQRSTPWLLSSYLSTSTLNPCSTLPWLQVGSIEGSNPWTVV